MKIDYRRLAEKYLSMAKQVAEELQANRDIIGIAALGSTATGDVHLLSDIDLLVLVNGSGTFQWERKTVQNIVVNIALRSRDVLERMAKDHPDTIFGLKNALILCDPQGILQSLKKDATMTDLVEEELLGDLLDEARSFIGKAEKASAESRLESSTLCLRQGVVKLAEFMLYKERGNRANPMYFWEEIEATSLPLDFKRLFLDIQGFEVIERTRLVETLKKLKTFLPELRK